MEALLGQVGCKVFLRVIADPVVIVETRPARQPRRTS